MSAPTDTRTPASAPPSPPPRGPALGRVVLGGLLVLLGLVWLAEATNLFDVRWRTVLAAAVLGIGVVLVASARGRSADNLIGLGVVLGIVLIVTSTSPGAPVLSGAGERTYRPQTVAQLQDDYELGAGPLTLDLRDLTVPSGETPVDASVGAGDLVVRLPAGTAADIEASGGIGEVSVLGRRSGGFGNTVAHSVEGAGPGGRLVLRLSVGIGRIEVTR